MIFANTPEYDTIRSIMPHLHEYFYIAPVLDQFVEQIHPHPKREKKSDFGIGGKIFVSAKIKWFERVLSEHEKCELVLSHLQATYSDFVGEEGSLCKNLDDGFAVSSINLYEFTIPLRGCSKRGVARERRLWVNVLDGADYGTTHPICRSLVLLEPWDSQFFDCESKRSPGSTFSALAAMIFREKTKLLDTAFADLSLIHI